MLPLLRFIYTPLSGCMEVSVQLKWHKGALAQRVSHLGRSRDVIPEEGGAVVENEAVGTD